MDCEVSFPAREPLMNFGNIDHPFGLLYRKEKHRTRLIAHTGWVIGDTCMNPGPHTLTSQWPRSQYTCSRQKWILDCLENGYRANKIL